MGLITASAKAYARMMAALLPPGKLWRLDTDGVLMRVFLAAGDELARVSERAKNLVHESDPRAADELLTDFERQLGLEADGTIAKRRGRVVSLLVRRQRFRPVDFQQALGAILGLSPEDIAVIERGRAFAVTVGDDRAIYHFFIYRDPSAPGSYDLAGAQQMVDRMKPAHTLGTVIESIRFRCDDPYSQCDRDLLGA